MRTSLIACAAFLLLLAAPVSRARTGESLLVATESSQAIQNARANRYHLTRLRDLAMVRDFCADGLLVSVPERTPYYYVDGVPANYRYLRPWSRLFLDHISREFYLRFGQPLRVTSMLRTVQVQRRLAYTNPNAADATGADRSSHLTGATLDISKKFMGYRGELWMRSMLLQLKREGYLYAIEEFQEPCFHVMVFPTYREYTAPRQFATADRPSAKVRVRYRRRRRHVRRRAPATHASQPSAVPAQSAATQSGN
jgi:hypothetical protein